MIFAQLALDPGVNATHRDLARCAVAVRFQFAGVDELVKIDATAVVATALPCSAVPQAVLGYW